jgi:hypothetical protein
MGNRTTGLRVGTGQLYMTSEMRLEVLTALNMKTVALREVAPCSLVHRYQRFGLTCLGLY